MRASTFDPAVRAVTHGPRGAPQPSPKRGCKTFGRPLDHDKEGCTMSDVTPTRSEAQPSTSTEDDVQANWQRVVGRRSFLKGVGLAGAAALPGSALLTGEAFARSSSI